MSDSNAVEDTGKHRRLRLWFRLAHHLPWLVLAILLLVTYQLWKNAQRDATRALQTEFDFRVRDAADRLSQRMQYYEQVLYGARAFFANQHQVERHEFHGYITSLALEKNFPGIQGVSFAPLVPAAQRQAHVESVRKDGLGDYAIRPEGKRNQYAPVAFIEPPSGRNQRAIGFDNLSDPVRKGDIEMARDMDRAVISEKLVLMQEDNRDPQAGFLMFLPVYTSGVAHNSLAERRANIVGWLAASFRMNDLMTGVLGERVNELDIELYDGDKTSQQGVMYDSDDRASRTWSPLFKTSNPIDIAGHHWLMTVHSLPAFETRMDKFKTQSTAIVGGVLSLFLALITWLLVRDRARALHYAGEANLELATNKRMQRALKESEQRWKLALEGANHAMWDLNVRTGDVKCSGLYDKVLGYPENEHPHRLEEWLEHVHPDDRERVMAAYQAHLDGKSPAYDEEERMACKNGGWKWVATRGMVVERDAHGNPLRMIGTHTDISGRRAMEAALRLSEAKLHAILDNAPIGIWLVGVDGHYHFVNKTFCDAVGVPESAFLSAQQLSDVLEPVAAAGCVKSDRECLAQDTPHLSEEVLTFVDGKSHLLEIRKVQLRDYHGETVGVIGIAVDVTERRAGERQLRESEEKYRGIFDNAQDFIFTLDSASRLTSITNYFCLATGYSQKEVIGASIGKFLTPESLEYAQQMISLKLRGESVVTQYEVEILAKDGHIIPIELNTSLTYKDGKLAGIQGIGRDITERRSYEQALRENEEKYRGLFENVGDFAYCTDLNGNFTAVSQALLDALGFNREELINSSISKILTPEDLKLAQQMTGAKLAGQKHVTRYELSITSKDGHAIPIEIVSTLSYKDGKPVGVQGIGRDISERKQAEEALLRSERNYRELMEQAGDAILVADHEGRQYLDVNQSACELLGYSREELLALGPRSILFPGDPRGNPAVWDDILLGKSVQMERLLRHKSGNAILVEMKVKMLPDGRLQSMARDSTERHAREEALQAANVKAEAASRAKGEFLANMSHEIRTPMNSVIGMARLALVNATEARQRDYLEKILMSGEHLLGIIDDILDFSKMDAGKLRMEMVDFDLPGVMDNITSLMTGKAVAKGVDFVLDVAPDLPRSLRGDPLRLRQVLLNFIDNAIKFTQQGKVAVNVQRVAEDADGCQLRFEVRDTGIGMSDAEISRLFQSFQQTDGSITRKYGGTGLGLAISKRLVELMGGEVGVESEEGRGSTFWFRVKLPHGRQGAALQEAAHLDGQHAIQKAVRGAHILLAENNLFNQQVAREFLERAGATVSIVNNGSEAVQLLRQERFDCVLMDVQMPVMDGLQATRQIRAYAEYAELPVIAMTANALDEERERCLAAGMNDFIAKPVLPEMLYAVLAKWLSRQASGRGAFEGRTDDLPESPARGDIDLTVLAEMIGNDQARLREFAGKFLVSAQQDMIKVEAALQDQDLATLCELGHHIKSPARMVGAMEFGNLCQALENNRDDLGKAREIVSQMRVLLQRIERKITSLA